MRDSLYIAWRYVSFNRAKTVPLVVCVALILTLPLSFHLLSKEVERQVLSPPVLVPEGSSDSPPPVAPEAGPSGLESRGSEGPSANAGYPAVSAEGVHRLLGILFIAAGVMAVLLLGLALLVSVLLRGKEMFALYRLGSPRAAIARQMGLEVLMVGVAGGVLCSVLLLVVQYYAGGLVGTLIRL